MTALSTTLSERFPLGNIPARDLRLECRGDIIIGGDLADIRCNAQISDCGGFVEVFDVELLGIVDDLAETFSDDDALNMANDIIQNAYASIGAEAFRRCR